MAETTHSVGASPSQAYRIPKSAGLNRRPRPGEDFIRIVLFLCGLASILTTVGIIVTLGNEALYFFTNWNYLETQNSNAEALTIEDTQIALTSGGVPWRVDDVVHIDDELMRVTNVSEDRILTVERGFSDTAPVEHVANRPLQKAVRVSLLDYFGSTEWAPQIGRFGVWPLLMSTIIITFIALLVSLPLGLGSAIYLSEYAKENQRQVIKPILELLAGIPTVVLGFFALTFVSPALRSVFGDALDFQNMLSAGLVVGFLLIPLVSTMSEDALRAVPMAMREASFGLGATKFETATKVLVPSALSGILAAVLLAGSRAFGETMIVALAAGSGPRLTFNPLESAETITGHIARISSGDVTYHSVDYNSLFSLALILFVVTLLLNIISNIISARFREAYQ